MVVFRYVCDGTEKELPFPVYIDDKDLEKCADTTSTKFLLLQAEIEELYRRLTKLSQDSGMVSDNGRSQNDSRTI